MKQFIRFKLRNSCSKTGNDSDSWNIRKRLFSSGVLLLMSSLFLLYGQTTITGKVTDAGSGDALPGVNVIVTGTNTGVVTDLDGNYSIEVPSADASLTFSYIGYVSETMAIAGKTVIDVVLVPDVQSLDEVVVIGYGVQKKKLITGANLNVEGEDIKRMNTTSSMDALKGLTPGVTITQNNGQPGSGSKVYIRGMGTIGNANPLYIVDGVAVSDIDFLSPADIESVDVLKDAASAAIYGSRAANGVILVTTKRGTKGGKTTVSFDSYAGIQNMYRKPEMLNAQQYAEIMNEGRRTPYNYANLVPDWSRIESGEWQGTNWVDEFENPDAPVYSNTLNVTGGSERSSFSLGASHYSKEGILGTTSDDINKTYKRINLRLNSDHILWNKSGRDIISIGETFTYTNEKNPTLRTGNIYWNDFHNMLVTSPFLPMYATDDNDPAYPYHYAINYNSMEANPIAGMELNSRNNTNNNNTILGSIYGEIQPVKNLRLRSSFGINNYSGYSRHWQPEYHLSSVSNYDRDQVDMSMYSGFTWTSTTTLTYNFSVNKSHNMSVMVGNEAQKNAVDLDMDGHNEASIFNSPDYAYLNNFPQLDASNAVYANFGGKDEYGWGLLSYYGRFTYDFKEKYLLNVNFRADGSSKFDKGNKWGYFPSVSAGWLVSSEPFMDNVKDIMNYAKIRASWGQNGNQEVNDFAYLSTLTYDNANYFFGPDKSVRSIGAYPARVPNPSVKWETQEMTNIGLDANFLNNKLQFSFDWYVRNTYDWLIEAPSSATDGTAAPLVNGGNVQNRGLEFLLRWNERSGDLSYGITGTLAFNKNEVTDIPNEEGIIHGYSNVLSQGTGEMYRAEEGYPIGYFWGYETDGILQNDAEVDAWVGPEGDPYFATAQPGDVKFVDQNNDGSINDDDKVMIGDPNPDLIFGLQFNVEFKGIYLNFVGNGMAGHQIARSYRSFADSPRQNYTTEILERWHGEGTSNRIPRLTESAHRNTQFISDLYIEDGDFFRISNVTLGYNLKKLFRNGYFPDARIYVSGQNLAVITKYKGIDPEVGYSPDGQAWGKMIDLGLYPSARTYMLGLSINF